MNNDKTNAVAPHATSNKIIKPYGSSPNTASNPIKAPIVFGHETESAAAHTPWPRFGRIAYDDLLQTSSHTRSSAPRDKAGLDVLIYMAGCAGLQNKAKSYMLPLFKVGVTQIPDLQVRQRDLNVDAYGSVSFQNGEPVSEPK